MSATQIASILPLLLLTFCFPAHAAEPAIISSPPPQEEYNENWNSHIDNQAYLQQLRRQRQEDNSPKVIIINRDGRKSSPYRHSPCWSNNCEESWEVEYHDQDSSIIYRENYRPSQYQPILIRPEPRSRKHRIIRQGELDGYRR